MSSPKSSYASGSELKALVLLLVIFAVFGLVNAGSQSRQQEDRKAWVRAQGERYGLPNYMDKPEESGKYVEVLALKCGGDYEKLAEEERRWVDGMTAGHGAEMIKGTAERLKKEAAAKKKAAQKKTAEKKGGSPQH